MQRLSESSVLTLTYFQVLATGKAQTMLCSTWLMPFLKLLSCIGSGQTD